MHKFALAFHHAVFEGAFVLMSFRPDVSALAVHLFVLKITLVSGPVTVNSEALPVSPVQLPPTFVFGQNAVAVALTVIDLKSISMSNFVVSFYQLRCT